jgi:hypothetical protein
VPYGQKEQSGQGFADQRADDAFRVRQSAALQERQAPPVTPIANGDEVAFPNRIGNYSKGLPHNARGVVDTFRTLAVSATWAETLSNSPIPLS